MAKPCSRQQGFPDSGDATVYSINKKILRAKTSDCLVWDKASSNKLDLTLTILMTILLILGQFRFLSCRSYRSPSSSPSSLRRESGDGGRLGAMARSREFSRVGAMMGVGAARRDEEGPSSSGLASGRRSEGHVPPRRRTACVAGPSLCAFLGTCVVFASMASGSSGGGVAALRQKSCWGGKAAAVPPAAGECMSRFDLLGEGASTASAEVLPIPIVCPTAVACPRARCNAGSD